MKIPRWLAWPAFCVFLMLGPAMAAEEPSPDGAPMNSEALSALNLMAETLAQAQGFSVTIRAGFDVVQDTARRSRLASGAGLR